MVLRQFYNSGMPSIDACLPKASLIVQSNGATLAVIEDELPGSIAASCFVLEKREPVGSLVG